MSIQAKTLAIPVFDDSARFSQSDIFGQGLPTFPLQIVLGNDQGSCETDVDVNIMDKPPPVSSRIIQPDEAEQLLVETVK